MLNDELKLTHVVTDEHGDSFELELEVYEGNPLLGVEVSLWENTIFKAVDTTPEHLELLADTLYDWAHRLRIYQSQRLTNNLFEE